MVLALQHYIDSDPILCAVQNGTVSWDEAFTEEEEAAFQASLHDIRGQFIDNKRSLEEKPRVRWADEAISETPPPLTKLLAPTPSATPAISANPRNIKTLFVRNLPRDVTVAEMQAMFAPFGALHDVYVPKNTERGKYFGTIKGFALIKYKHYSESTRAFLDVGATFHLRGKEVSIEFAKQDQH
jgi:hypothetical protein